MIRNKILGFNIVKEEGVGILPSGVFSKNFIQDCGTDVDIYFKFLPSYYTGFVSG